MDASKTLATKQNKKSISQTSSRRFTILEHEKIREKHELPISILETTALIFRVVESFSVTQRAWAFLFLKITSLNIFKNKKKSFEKNRSGRGIFYFSSNYR